MLDSSKCRWMKHRRDKSAYILVLSIKQFAYDCEGRVWIQLYIYDTLEIPINLSVQSGIIKVSNKCQPIELRNKTVCRLSGRE